MKIIVNEKDGCCESITIEYTPTEALIINHAMRRYVNDKKINEKARIIMKQMLDVEPIFREIKAESESTKGKEESERDSSFFVGRLTGVQLRSPP